MGVMEEAERFEPRDPQEWSDWLARNHDTARGVWLVTPRRSAGRATVDYETAVTEALRFGWVDSTTKVLDDARGMMWFSPRKPTSGWAGTNKRRIERLVAEGRLEPAGERSVRVAQENGSWTLLDDVESLVVPSDLAIALDQLPGAHERWDAATPSARRMALTRIVQAKRPETRAKRVQATAQNAAAGRPLAG